MANGDNGLMWFFIWFNRDDNGIILGYSWIYPWVMTKIASENGHLLKDYDFP